MRLASEQKKPSGYRGGALLAGLIAVASLTGCTAAGVAGSDASGSTTKVSGPSGSALKLLDTIKIKGRAPTTGYSREAFGPAWADTDHNGCDQRDDILRRDLTSKTFQSGTHGCVVLSGTLVDHYTGKTISFTKSSATAVQIDHVVPLENAWVTGADKWTESKREELATDPLNLLAADGPTNESKGSGDAATWLPRKSYRCDYVARQVAVKAKYDAWMTSAEHKAIADILATCPKEKLPQETSIPLGNASGGSVTQPSVGSAGSSSKSSGSSGSSGSGSGSGGSGSGSGSSGSGSGSGGSGSSGSGSGSGGSGSSGSQGTVSAGAFCSPAGAKGTSKAGTKMVCSSKSGAAPRWRSAT